jgi:hypothetical protein
MARGTDPVNDPRWEGQDSLSLPNRPAHPDPSRVADSDPDGQAVHGIHGHTDKKHGLIPEDEVRANIAANDAAYRAELETERDAVQAAVDSGSGGDEMKARLQNVRAALSPLRASTRESSDAAGVARASGSARRGGPVDRGDADGQDGKRGDSIAQNAPVDEKGK